jgi:hypothetical protein
MIAHKIQTVVSPSSPSPFIRDSVLEGLEFAIHMPHVKPEQGLGKGLGFFGRKVFLADSCAALGNSTCTGGAESGKAEIV